MKSLIWNPWHGCKKYSEGCAHCYVYRRDAAVGRDAAQVTRTKDFNWPTRRRRDGAFSLPDGAHVYACMTSDFFLPEADPWRAEAWACIRARPEVSFSIITKRISRMEECLPPDWGEGYENVEIGLTCENQRRAEERMDIFLRLPIRSRFVICEPLLGPVDLAKWLDARIGEVVAGGESGPGAREMRYEWVLALREQCRRAGVGFHFKQTGANFVKDGRRFCIERALQMPQAKKAGIDIPPVSTPSLGGNNKAEQSKQEEPS